MDKSNFIWVVLGICLLAYVGNSQHIPGAPYNNPPKDNSGIVQQQSEPVSYEVSLP